MINTILSNQYYLLILLMIITAFPVGFFAGYFGIGGGLISVPVLFFIFEDLDFWKGFSFMPIAALSSIIPSAPGYIGVINYAMTSWSSFLDLFESSYAYYSFLIVFLMWFTTCIMGVLFLIKSPKLVANFFKSLYK